MHIGNYCDIMYTHGYTNEMIVRVSWQLPSSNIFVTHVMHIVMHIGNYCDIMYTHGYTNEMIVRVSWQLPSSNIFGNLCVFTCEYIHGCGCK